MYLRKLSLDDGNNDSIFLWGARQVGKTTLLEQLYPTARYYDLFQEDFPAVRAIIVSLDKYPRVMNGVEIIPAEQFLKALWNSEII